MGNQKTNNKAAEAAALLKEKEDFLAALPETATPEEIAAAEKEVTEAKAALGALDSTAAKSTTKIQFIKSPTGAFKLAYNVGEKANFDVKQAAELIEAGFAKAVK